ncbi:MAG: hypothetical protein JWQ75_17 [Pseudarthrobacter sp.]|nr:hypothetical protein [Pseudarthrobacter sp.]
MTKFPQTLPAPIPDWPAGPIEGEGTRSPGVVEVNVQSAADLDEALDNAIALVTNAAKRHQIGIMVTRTGEGRYVVRAHPEVPYGLIRQRHAMGGIDGDAP